MTHCPSHAEPREDRRSLGRTPGRLESSAGRLERILHPCVTFGVMPAFALANAGVRASLSDLSTLASRPATLGVALGLIAGKQMGIRLFTRLAVRVRLSTPPAGVSWRRLHGAACLGGIGFTMSLFIAHLAFGEGPLLSMAKIGVLVASLIAGAAGWVILVRAAQDPPSASA